MLVLSRKRGDSVVLSNGVTVTVVEVRGDKVRIGFEAPAEVAIDRQEVRDKPDYVGREIIMVKRQRIQTANEDIADLGRRDFDPLGLGPVYRDLELIDE